MKVYLKVIEPKSTYNYVFAYMDEMRDMASRNKGKVFDFEKSGYKDYFVMINKTCWYWHKDWLTNVEKEGKNGQLLLNFD